MEHPSEDLRTVLSRDPETMEALIAKMQSVQREVGRVGLGHLEPFQRVYLELTTRVNDRITAAPHPENGSFFKECDSLQRTARIFADYWFNPLKDYVDGNEELTKAWQPLLQDKRAKEASSAIQFLLGMNTHITFDLPQALLKSKPTQEYYDDFLAVDDLIRETAHELSKDLVVINRPEHKTRAIDLTTTGIKRLRAQAWTDYKELQRYEDAGDKKSEERLIKKLERRTMRRSKMILWLGDRAIKAVDRAPVLSYL